MTEKRFKLDSEVGVIDTQKCGGDTISNNEVVELLNELHEENMMLKGEVAHYKLILMSLEKEAKRLSQIHCRRDVE